MKLVAGFAIGFLVAAYIRHDAVAVAMAECDKWGGVLTQGFCTSSPEIQQHKKIYGGAK